MAELEIETEVTGNVWKILCQVGDQVVEEQELIIRVHENGNSRGGASSGQGESHLRQ